MKISAIYKGEKRFQSGDGEGTLTMDAPTQMGGLGEGPGPKSLLLYGLAGCTGLDVVTILEKKKVTYENFALEISADQTNKHPKIFKDIKVVYKFKTDEANRKDIERAIELSEKQFCGVSAMLSKAASIETELVIE